jgi:Ion transport protein
MYCGNNDDHPEVDITSDNITGRSYINYGITNFDSLPTALLSVFQIINSDTWYQQLIDLMDLDIPAFGAVYVILMIVVGQFFLMNLILAVIIFAFIKTQKQELSSEIKLLQDESVAAGNGGALETQKTLAKDPNTPLSKQTTVIAGSNPLVLAVKKMAT